MGHCRDELLRRLARELRIGIQRDDILDVAQHGRVPDNHGKRIASGPPQQGIQIRQFSALALMTHPGTLAPVPAARAMKKKEWPPLVRARRIAALEHILPTFIVILAIQLFDQRAGMIHQYIVLGERFLVRIHEIRQQTEIHILVAIGQKPHFERFGEIRDLRFARQQGRYYRQCRKCRRYPI